MTPSVAARLRRRDRSVPAVSPLTVDLVRVRSALAAGLSPTEALATARHPELVRIAGRLGLGRSIATLAADEVADDRGITLLLGALAVAERAGGGGGVAVDQALAAIRQTQVTDGLLAVKTAQARGTATLMAAVPAVAWVALVLLDTAALRFYTTLPGVITGGLALACMLTGRWWSRKLVLAAADAPTLRDPLRPPPRRPDLRRGAVGGVLGGAVAGSIAGLSAGVVAATVVGLLLARARPAPQIDLRGGGTAELTELIALAAAAGLSLPAAVRLVAELGPPAGRAPLARAARLLQSGQSPTQAFAGSPLTVLGELLGAAERFGAPAGPVLRDYAAELRAQRRVAAEEAAERTQLALVFPTTLLILPGFALAVVPPLVWMGFAT